MDAETCYKQASYFEHLGIYHHDVTMLLAAASLFLVVFKAYGMSTTGTSYQLDMLRAICRGEIRGGILLAAKLVDSIGIRAERMREILKPGRETVVKAEF